METKKPWLSKTLIINALIAVLALAWPSGKELIAGNPDVVMAAMAGLNIILRLISKEKVSLGE
jgi:hypothetical protein